MGTTGRPLKFKTPKQLQHSINKYYQHCEDKGKPLTIAGLACYLEVDRQTIYNYEAKDEFFGTIKRARDNIIAGLEEALFTEGKAGQIFLAKNYGYSDRQEIEHSGEMTQNINSKPDLSKLSKEELIALDKLLSKSNTDTE